MANQVKSKNAKGKKRMTEDREKKSELPKFKCSEWGESVDGEFGRGQGDDLVASRSFCLVQGCVGSLHNRFRGVGRRRVPLGQAATDSGIFDCGDREFGDLTSYSFKEDLSAGQRRFRHNEDELIAAVTCDNEICFPDTFAKELSEEFKCSVSGGVS